jgi:sterol desaturase/sphingolipid hydroxylase (fatty acid hydroxylase superfamily)
MAKPYKSIRLFKSDFCEFFTHVHPITPLVIFLPVVIGFLYQSCASLHMAAGTVGAWFGFGVFFWSLFEYLWHRFGLHFPAEKKIGQRFVYIMHGLHHEDAVDPTRLVMPPFAGVILAFVLFLLFRSVLGPLHVNPFFAGFIAGYLCYDYTHYAVHHFTPRTRLGKYLKQHHMQHHYVSQNARWGVSSPLWDCVFGTLEEAERVQHGS